MKRSLLMLGLLFCASVHAEVYRSIDESGKVHYGDSPLQGSDDVEELKVDKAPTPGVDLPYQTQIAMKNFPVTLYTFPNCGSSCDIARDSLVKRGIPFTEKSLTMKEDLDTYRKESGDNKFPGLHIGKTWLGGYQPEQWTNELNFAGYPKSAPITYRPPASSPAAAPAE